MKDWHVLISSKLAYIEIQHPGYVTYTSEELINFIISPS